MARAVKSHWLALLAGILLALLIVSLFSGGGKALATSFAVLLSGRSAQGTQLGGIEVLSWSHGVSTTREAGSGLATGRRQYQPLLIRKRIDKATPLLHRAMGQSETFPSLQIAITETGQSKEDAVTMTLTNAQVIQIATGDVDGDGVAEESVSFTYEKIEWTGGGVTYQGSGGPELSPPTFFMAINEKGLPGRAKKQTKASAYRTQITRPRDAGSGLPTGKRQHSPFQLVMPNSGDAPELTQAFLTSQSLERVSVITYGPDGQPLGAVSLVGVQVVGMTETRRTSTNPLYAGNGTAGTNPLYEASRSTTEMECVYELHYQKIEWLDASGVVTHEDTWETQR